MSREAHVRICGSREVRLLPATRPVWRPPDGAPRVSKARYAAAPYLQLLWCQRRIRWVVGAFLLPVLPMAAAVHGMGWPGQGAR